MIFKIILSIKPGEEFIANFVYIPILAASVFWGFEGGIISGLAGGLIMSDIPAGTLDGNEEKLILELLKVMFFTGFGSILGYVLHIKNKKCRELEKSVHHDVITALPNRTMLIEDIDELIFNRVPFSLAAIHIENMREIFNIIGPSKGDMILRSIADYLEEKSKEKNVCLYNSHSLKFEILLKKYNVEETKAWMKKLRGILKAFPVMIDNSKIYLDFTLGGTCSDGEYRQTDLVIKEAYDAIRNAQMEYKESCLFDRKNNINILTTYLVSQIKSAIDNDEFYLEYQPKLNMGNNMVEGVEALVRWKHPKLGIISPGVFIPKLERTDFIKRLTWWVLNRVVDDINEWEERGISLSVAVNICPRDLKDKEFNNRLLDMLEKKGHLSNEKIQLEITETDLIVEMDSIVSKIEELRRNNIKVSIDDFGTGYSSLSYLSSLPIDCIKVDRSFVMDIFKDDKKKELVKNIVNFVHSMGKHVIAEGVEDEETFDFLKKLNCEEIQGYYVAKPMMKEKLIEYIKRAYGGNIGKI